MYCLSWFYFRLIILLKKYLALDLQDQKERVYNSDQKRTDGEKKKKNKRESKRPPSMGHHLGQHGSNWSKRPRGNGPWRACAGLTKRVEEKVYRS